MKKMIHLSCVLAGMLIATEVSAQTTSGSKPHLTNKMVPTSRNAAPEKKATIVAQPKDRTLVAKKASKSSLTINKRKPTAATGKMKMKQVANPPMTDAQKKEARAKEVKKNPSSLKKIN